MHNANVLGVGTLLKAVVSYGFTAVGIMPMSLNKPVGTMNMLPVSDQPKLILVNLESKLSVSRTLRDCICAPGLSFQPYLTSGVCVQPPKG